MDDETTPHPAKGEENAGRELELEQLLACLRPVPRVALTARQRAAFWVLRVVAVVVSAMVIYAFIVALR